MIFLIWREKQSASGVRLWTTNKMKWWAYKWPVARSSKGHRSAVSCLNKMQKIRNSFLNIWPKLCSHKFSPIQLDLKLRVTFRFMRVNNFWHLIKIKEIKKRKQQSASSKIRVTRTEWDAKRSEKQELSKANRSASRKQQNSNRDLRVTRNKV